MKRNKLLIIILIVIILFIVGMGVFTKTAPPPPPDGKLLPTPTIINIPAKEPINLRIVKSRIIRSLPFFSNGYSIQYLPVEDKFLITILLNPYQQYKEEATEWLEKKGLKDQSLVNIRWSSIRGVTPR